MRRREFLGVLGGAAAAWPIATRAREQLPIIGFVSAGSPGPFTDRVTAFRDGLKAIGFEEGRNVVFEFRWLGGDAMSACPRWRRIWLHGGSTSLSLAGAQLRLQNRQRRRYRSLR